jgi:hypothetical protein
VNESLGADSGTGSYGESSDSTGEKVFEYASEYGPTDLDELRELASSGAITGLGGAVTVLRGLGSLRRGETGRGLFRLATGVLLLALAVAQRRTRDEGSGGRGTGTAGVDQTDVTGSTTDLEDVSSGLDTDEGRGTDADPASVVDTGSDVEDVSTGLDAEDRDASVDDMDRTDVADTGPDVGGIDTDSDPGSTSQERADRSDHGSDTEGDRDTDDGGAGVSTDSGEVGVEEETSDGVGADVDTDDEDEESR